MRDGRTLRLLYVIGLGLFPLTVAAQQPARETPKDESAQAQGEEQPLAFFVSPGVLRNGLDRLVDEIDDELEFDDEQYMAVRRLLRERVTGFLQEHHKELNHLANTYFEAYYAGEPPDSVYVADFADRALPQLLEFNEFMHELADGFREICNEDQVAMIDSYMAGFEVAVEAGQERLKAWSEGYFDPETEWRGSPAFRAAELNRKRELENRMVAASRAKIEQYRSGQAAGETPPNDAAADAAKPPAGAADDSWEAYVRAFIARYQLDSEKQQRAWQYHARYAEDRDRYLRRKLDDMSSIERMYAEAIRLEGEQKSDEAARMRARADAEMAKIENNVNEIFERLKE
ncbi:MAG: hypothetical protein D6744_02620, partial [Planctomycetota bacterium]